MGKFNNIKVTDKRGARIPGSPIQTSKTPDALTYNGAAGYEYETLSQLFLLACSNMVGEDTFYEKANERDHRFTSLIYQAIDEGHSGWISRFFPWLRNQANMRSAATIGAVEAARAMVNRKIPGGRQLINSVLVRADEPGEALAYFMAHYGRNIPKPIKRGVADAVQRLYTERNTLKYNGGSKGLSFGDVIELVHPSPATFNQGDLFKWLLAQTHKRDLIEYPDTLPMIQAHALLRRDAAKHPEVLLNTTRLRQAGMTWEAAKSLAGGKVTDAEFWRAMIPEMGYMALLRNLRNFDQAGLKNDMVVDVVAKLTSQAEVWKSRQLPMRFLSAYRNVPSNTWAQPLETALDLCLQSIPEFPGRTLILIDTSGSMGSRMSGKSELQYWEAATVFGLAMAARCDQADVVSFSSTNRIFPKVKGESLLKAITRFQAGYFYGDGTNTALAVRNHYQSHDRVVILTDEQADPNSGIYAPIGADKMCITFNLAGYKAGHAPTGANRVTIGGLSDVAFALLPALEGRGQGLWPF